MSEDIMVKNCAPTLAGMKTGNLFSCSFADGDEMRDCLRHWNQLLSGKGLRALPLRFRDGRALVYVYRISHLSRDLKDAAACCLLKERGYETEIPERCIVRLIRRLEEGLLTGSPWPVDTKRCKRAIQSLCQRRFADSALSEKRCGNEENYEQNRSGLLESDGQYGSDGNGRCGGNSGSGRRSDAADSVGI